MPQLTPNAQLLVADFFGRLAQLDPRDVPKIQKRYREKSDTGSLRNARRKAWYATYPLDEDSIALRLALQAIWSQLDSFLKTHRDIRDVREAAQAALMGAVVTDHISRRTRKRLLAPFKGC